MEDRYLLIGLACASDDYGRFWWKPQNLKAIIYPIDSKQQRWIEKKLIMFKNDGLLCKYIVNNKIALAMSILISANLMFHTNSIIITPDAPLTFFTINAIIFYYLAFFKSDKYIYLGGLMLGFAMLSKIIKYTSGYFLKSTMLSVVVLRS